jgi:hypothetical protein
MQRHSDAVLIRILSKDKEALVKFAREEYDPLSSSLKEFAFALDEAKMLAELIESEARLAVAVVEGSPPPDGDGGGDDDCEPETAAA